MKCYQMRGRLLAGASALSVLAALTSGPALAFNEVNWTWDAYVDELVTKRVIVAINLDPTGLVMLEDLQVQIGDVTATSYVSNVYNNPPSTGNGTTTTVVPVNLGQFRADGTVDTLGFSIVGTQSGGDVTLNPVLQSSGKSGGVLGSASIFGIWDLGTILVEVQTPNGGAALDALTQLPEVISAATAVGNNTSVDTDTAVELHEGQFVFGDGAVDGIGDALAVGAAGLLGVSLANNNVNSNLVGAGVVGTLAILGALEKADISATSTVSGILNATVDSNATAVANNLSVNIEAAGPDRLFMGDVVQVSYADVSATSNVSGIVLNNYQNLGLLSRPIVSSIATAVGNNKSITVRAPVVAAP